jgi:phage terminase large subunit
MTVRFASKKFERLFEKAHYKICYGGRAGGRSHSIATYLLIKSLQEKTKILCAREYQTSIKDSVHSLLVNKIDASGLTNYFNITDKSIKSTNGSEFIFTGFRTNTASIKSKEDLKYCWIEEGESTTYESLNIIEPTLIRNEGWELLIAFNPQNETDPVYERFIANKQDDSVLIYTTWEDNEFLNNDAKQQIVKIKETNPEDYNWIYGGNPRKLSHAVIFAGKYEVIDFQTPDDVHFYYGVDWGFANDPTAMNRSYIKDECLWVDHEIGGVGIEIDQLDGLFRQIPGAFQHEIIADNSRPETISYMNQRGWQVKGCKKYSGSVEDGIAFMKSFKKIIIHPRCKNTISEFGSYSYKTDRLTGQILPIIIDEDNHYIDGIRYSVESLMRYNGVPQIDIKSGKTLWGMR